MFNSKKKKNNIILTNYSENYDESNNYESDVKLLEVYFENNIHNSNNINEDTNNKLRCKNLKCKKTIFKFIEKKRYIFIFILHVLMHISLLSLLEPLFFFKYACSIENQVFLNKLKSVIVNISNNIKKIELDNTDFLKFLLKYFNLNSFNKIINYFNNLDNKSLISKKEKDIYNNKLEFISFIPSIILLSITFLYLIFVKYFLNIKTIYIFIEHIILILFIGLYEYWFFENILLEYKPISNAEIDNIFISCTFNNIKGNINLLNISKYEANCNL